MKNKTKKILKGFTLAEILIVIAIIGIVATLTIPIIKSKIQESQSRTAWKKAYTSLSQAYLRAKSDGYIFGSYGDANPSKWDTLKAYLNVVKECNGTTIKSLGNCWAASGVNPDSSILSGCSLFFNDGSQNNRKALATADGMYWLLYGDGSSTIAVDVNGATGPNIWGNDVFTLKLDAYGPSDLGACMLTSMRPKLKDYLLH